MWWIIGIIAAVIIFIVFCVASDNSREDKSSKPPRKNNYDEETSYRSFLNTPTFLPEIEKGEHAEITIGKILIEIADKIDNCHILNNVIIPAGKDENGNQRTVEIDHILFTPSGLFVIETKSRAGTIYGGVEDNDWHQVLGVRDQIVHSFFNPIKQNDIHIRVLKRLLRKNDLVCHSCIVFEDGDISNIDSEMVIKPNELKSFILNKTTKRIYNSIDLNGLYTRVLYYKEHPIKTLDEHIQEIDKKKHH